MALPPAASPAASPSPAEDPARRSAYADALTALLEKQTLPDGTVLNDALPAETAAENSFAVYDVDGDGQEELLVLYSTACMACMTGCVFAWDGGTGALRTELQEFPSLTFYANGIAEAGWSHNQGLAGADFWPYSLYRYAPDTDSYALVGMADAWARSVAATNGQGDPFPADADRSGTGTVYYIMTDGIYDDSHPVDVSVYNAWRSGIVGDAAELSLPWQSLTAEHIAQVRAGR